MGEIIVEDNEICNDNDGSLRHFPWVYSVHTSRRSRLPILLDFSCEIAAPFINMLTEFQDVRKRIELALMSHLTAKLQEQDVSRIERDKRGFAQIAVLFAGQYHP